MLQTLILVASSFIPEVVFVKDTVLETLGRVRVLKAQKLLEVKDLYVHLSLEARDTVLETPGQAQVAKAQGATAEGQQVFHRRPETWF